MTNEEAKILIDKYNKREASPFEVALLQYWFIHEASQNETALNEQELQQMVAGMRKEVLAQTKPTTRKLWPRIAAVAAAVAMVVFGVWFFNSDREILKQVQDDVVKNDIAPGKNGATLTLANGKVIQLSDAKSGVVIGEDLKYNDGEILRDALDDTETSSAQAKQGGEALVASTTKGQTYEFTLPDGTKVWLNAASKLSIPLGFSGTETRKVELTGEAYFEVAKNKKRPFIVESNGQEVTVLGTHFNINAYQDEGSIKTTLLEGSVKVTAFGKTTPASPPLLAKEGTSIVLKPNQQSVITGSNRITVKDVDPADAIAWQKGYFLFEREHIKDVMRKVARWYDVEVIYEGNTENIIVGGTVSRFSNVSKVLGLLQETGAVKFRIEGRKVHVYK